MAESSLESFLTCPVCLDILTEPVSLSCHHSFCKRCLREHWAQKPSRPCPVCRRRSSKDTLKVNFALRELSIPFRQKLLLTAPTEGETSAPGGGKTSAPGQGETSAPGRGETSAPGGGETSAPGQGETSAPGGAEPEEPQAQERQWSVCLNHPQVPPLFCLKDRRPLCPLCEFSLHPQHTVVSGVEAEKRLKELISSQLQALTEEKHQCEKLQQKYEHIQHFSEKQAAHCELHIRALFSRLHEFLQEEEQRALSSLRDEQLRQNNTMGPELEKVLEKLRSVDKSIQELKQQLETHTYRPQQDTSTLPQPRAGLLLDQAKVLGNLGFRVWSRMKRQVKYQPVVLDPNTAHRRLSLSDDLSSVRNTETLNEDLPDVPERFSECVIVLGSVGYSSGTVQWDVEVGDYPNWALGVVKESIQRKQGGEATFKNERLFLDYYEEQYYSGFKLVKVRKSPEKIRVKLDFNKGTLSFSDADAMRLLCTVAVPEGTSSEKLFPFFCVGPAGGAEAKGLRICEAQSGDSQSRDVPLLF